MINETISIFAEGGMPSLTSTMHLSVEACDTASGIGTIDGTEISHVCSERDASLVARPLVGYYPG